MLYSDKRINGEQKFEYEIPPDNDYDNPRLGCVRIVYNRELKFDTVKAVRMFRPEFLVQISHILLRFAILYTILFLLHGLIL